MKKSILFSVLIVGATLLQAQSITVHQTCGQNGQVLVIETNGHECVDLGLPSGTLWATCNVGAESPEGYGDYFAWGETSTKETYNWSTYFDTNDGGSTFSKYNNNGGKTILDPEDDAAHVNWGGSWRMPTKAEWQELLDNCIWTWTTQNGINGYMVTSNKAGYTDKFIFLPAAGDRYESDLYDVGSLGYFLSSSLLYSPYAWNLRFKSDYHDLCDHTRYVGHSVRAVLQPSSIPYSSHADDTIRIYSNGCDDYQTFIGSNGGQLTMTASSDQWSHFVQWNDGNTDNPRTITTNGNASYTAEFAKYIFSITKNAEHGTISGDSYAEYLDFVTLTVTPDYGYHFTQWSDGLKDNPRIFQITKDTAFTAEFAVDRTGKCGDNLALTWVYELESKTLTISGEGALNSNYTFGVEAPTQMQALVIDSGVTSIGSSAFSGCTGLTSVTIPNSVTIINNWAFENCSGLTSVTIPNSVTSIRWGVFSGCSGLTSIEIPNSVTSIGENAFWGCSGLTSVTIPNSVTSIGESAFYSCSGLTSIEAPAVLFNVVPETQWPNNTKILNRVTVNAGELTENALLFINRSHKTLQTLDVSGVTNTEFADEAFKGYYNLQELVLPAGLEKVSYMMVAECKNLQSIAIPASVTEIDQSAFENCRSMASVEFLGDALTRIGNWAFYNCHALENIEIPAGVTEIGAGAFYGCTYLNNLSMPASVQSIGDNAFALCSKISQMDVDAVEPPAVEDKTFYEISTEAPVYVPDESVTTYKAHPVWGRLNIIGKSDTPQGIDNANANAKATKILLNGQIFILRGEKVYTLQGQEVK